MFPGVPGGLGCPASGIRRNGRIGRAAGTVCVPSERVFMEYLGDSGGSVAVIPGTPGVSYEDRIVWGLAGPGAVFGAAGCPWSTWDIRGGESLDHLDHSIEVAYLMNVIAGEMGLDPILARRAGL